MAFEAAKFHPTLQTAQLHLWSPAISPGRQLGMRNDLEILKAVIETVPIFVPDELTWLEELTGMPPIDHVVFVGDAIFVVFFARIIFWGDNHA